MDRTRRSEPGRKYVDGYGQPCRVVVRVQVTMRKGGAIRSAESAASITGKGAFLTAPEDVPASLLTDGSGKVIKGAFRIGPYVCTFEKARKSLPVVTMTGGGLIMPFHLVVKDWHDGQGLAMKAALDFQAGKTPERGVFRRIGEGLPRSSRGA